MRAAWPRVRSVLAGAVRRARMAHRRRSARRQVRAYLASHEVCKLQLGCGVSLHQGWLNSDITLVPDTVFIDVRRPFPIDSEAFGFVYCEHLIEHLTFAEGLRMLSECHRVLAPGGRIRVATPDLSFLVRLTRSDRTEHEDAYLRWATAEFLRSAPACHPTFVVNNFFRDWGHEFIYDREVLRLALQLTGFVELRDCRIGCSDEPHLAGLETTHRMPDGFLELETMVVEATRGG